MAQQRWRRFLPDRSQLWIPVAVLILVVAVAGFMNLASARNQALADHKAAAAQVDQLRDQQERLQGALTQAEDGGNVEIRGREYFGLGYEGETRVVAEGTVGAAEPTPATSTEEKPPFWVQWWNRLTQP